MGLQKLTEAELEELIDEQEFVLVDTLTIAILTIAGGFKLVGTAACLNPDDFDETLGRQVARRKAFDRLWELEGYHRLRAAHASPSAE